MKTVNYISMVFPSNSANESFARMAAACFAAQMDPNLDELSDIKTAVSEAVTNAIVHAYPSEIGKVAIKAKIVEGGELRISVRDWGVGMADTEEARRPMFTTGGDDRSGMGFTIMESFMDLVKVKSSPGRGTTVELRKRISKRVAAQ